MQHIQLFYKNTAGVDEHDIKQFGKKLQPEIEQLQAINNKGYDSAYASINLVYDQALRDSAQKLAEEKKIFSPECLIIAAIGGSNLGTKAIHEVLHGFYYNEHTSKMKVYFFDTIDSDAIHDMLFLVKNFFNQGKKILLNVVTKSGATTETIANFIILRQLFKQYYLSDYNKYIIITTQKNSPLWNLGQQESYSLLDIPQNVEGRFSVLSPVGLFPCALLGIDINALHQGALDSLTSCLSSNIEDNPAALSAIIKYVHYRYKKVNINNFFIFSSYLASLGAWYGQLMAESIGKEFNTRGERIYVGITPTVSVGPTDLHSLGQLYLGGPYDKFFTFCALTKYDNIMTIPDTQLAYLQANTLKGKSLQEITTAILQAVKYAYQQRGIPFCELNIPARDPYCIGQFLQVYMIEIMYLAFLLDVNPFDQPHVELYKKKTREILEHD